MLRASHEKYNFFEKNGQKKVLFALRLPGGGERSGGFWLYSVFGVGGWGNVTFRQQKVHKRHTKQEQIWAKL